MTPASTTSGSSRIRLLPSISSATGSAASAWASGTCRPPAQRHAEAAQAHRKNEEPNGRNKDSFWRYDAPKGGMFEKPENNGTVNCNAFCANEGGDWGPQGTCVGARFAAGPNAGQPHPCGQG